jgi:hypothetical protein
LIVVAFEGRREDVPREASGRIQGRERASRSAIAILVLALTGCTGRTPQAPAGVIDREAFITTFVELRDAAMRQPLKVLTDEERTRILAAHGVTEDQLVAFADAWGGDPAAMAAIWDDVRARMQPIAPPATTAP